MPQVTDYRVTYKENLFGGINFVYYAGSVDECEISHQFVTIFEKFV